MAYATIVKSPAAWRVRPNLRYYERGRTPDFWERAREELDGLPGGKGLNIAHETLVRHAEGELAGQLALRWLGRHGEVLDFSYADLDKLTNRLANVPQSLGLGKRPSARSRCRRAWRSGRRRRF